MPVMIWDSDYVGSSTGLCCKHIYTFLVIWHANGSLYCISLDECDDETTIEPSTKSNDARIEGKLLNIIFLFVSTKYVCQLLCCTFLGLEKELSTIRQKYDSLQTSVSHCNFKFITCMRKGIN